ncbi:MAG: FtsH protease activity modulator HflK [Nitrospirales bacterium]
MAWDPKEPWGQKSDPIDDLLRQAQTQLRKLGPFRHVKTLVLALVVIILVWQGAFIVAPDEEGVVKRFGNVVRTVGPGPHLKIPFIEAVLTPQVAKVHRIELGFRTDRQGRTLQRPQEAVMVTGDMNILVVEFIVQYRIKNAGEFLFNVAAIEETIEKAAEAAMREVIGRSLIDEALTTGKAQIQDETHQVLQQILDSYQAGVSIQAVQLQDVNPPEAVVAAFKDVASAKEDREKLINQSQSYRNDIIPKAKGEAAQQINQAEGYAKARVARAEGEANRFLRTLKEYNQARDVISQRIYLEAMEEILPNVEKVIIDDKAAGRLLPFLPLDRLKGQPQAKGTAEQKGASQ